MIPKHHQEWFLTAELPEQPLSTVRHCPNILAQQRIQFSFFKSEMFSNILLKSRSMFEIMSPHMILHLEIECQERVWSVAWDFRYWRELCVMLLYSGSKGHTQWSSKDHVMPRSQTVPRMELMHVNSFLYNLSNPTIWWLIWILFTIIILKVLIQIHGHSPMLYFSPFDLYQIFGPNHLLFRGKVLNSTFREHSQWCSGDPAMKIEFSLPTSEYAYQNFELSS